MWGDVRAIDVCCLSGATSVRGPLWPWTLGTALASPPYPAGISVNSGGTLKELGGDGWW